MPDKPDWGDGDRRDMVTTPSPPAMRPAKQETTPQDWSGKQDTLPSTRTRGGIYRPDWATGEISPAEQKPRYMHPGKALAAPGAFHQMLQLPKGLTQAWFTNGDPTAPERHLAEAQASAGAVLAVLTDDQRQIIEASFHGLPELAQGCIIHELSDNQDYDVDPLSDDEMDRLAESPEGELLMDFWGDEANTNWSRAVARMGVIADYLDEDDAEAAWAYFDSLPSKAKIACLCVLAEG
jgi:hypothetical protein